VAKGKRRRKNEYDQYGETLWAVARLPVTPGGKGNSADYNSRDSGRKKGATGESYERLAIIDAEGDQAKHC
jgi:hypothetical protein